MVKLQSKLLCSVLPLIPGLGLAVALIAIWLLESGWTEPTRNRMLAAELNNLNRLARLKTEFAGEGFRTSQRLPTSVFSTHPCVPHRA